MMTELIATLLLLAEPWDVPLTLRGIGSLRIGMPATALRAMGATEERYHDEEVDCAYWRAPRWPGLAMMVSGGRVVRICKSSRILTRAPKAIIWSIGRGASPTG